MKKAILVLLCFLMLTATVSCNKNDNINLETTDSVTDTANTNLTIPETAKDEISKSITADISNADSSISTDDYETIINIYREIVDIHKHYNPTESYEKCRDKFSQKWYGEIFNATLVGNVSNNSYGYAFSDLNSDDKSELILLLEDYTIIAIFSMVDGAPFMIGDFYSRKTCYIDNDKTICISGSNGADTWGYSEYTLSSDETKLDLLFEYGFDGYDSVNNKNIYYMIAQNGKEYISDQCFSELFASKPYLSITEAAEKTKKAAQLVFIAL